MKAILAVLLGCAMPLLMHAQQPATASQKGIVENEKGEPLEGVSVEIANDSAKIRNNAVTDSKGVYVASVQFDLMVELKGARTLNQRGAKARLKLERSGSGSSIPSTRSAVPSMCW